MMLGVVSTEGNRVLYLGHAVVAYAYRTGLASVATALMMPSDAASDRRVGVGGVLWLEGTEMDCHPCPEDSVPGPGR